MHTQAVVSVFWFCLINLIISRDADNLIPITLFVISAIDFYFHRRQTCEMLFV